MLFTTQVGTIPVFSKADRLRKARELLNVDQGEFAELAGMSRQTVSNYESGAREARGLYLRAWAEATGVDLYWLETGEAPSVDGASEDDVRPKRLELPTFWFGAATGFTTHVPASEWTTADSMAFYACADAMVTNLENRSE